jgi:hypothetical protein
LGVTIFKLKLIHGGSKMSNENIFQLYDRIKAHMETQDCDTAYIAEEPRCKLGTSTYKAYSKMPKIRDIEGFCYASSADDKSKQSTWLDTAEGPRGLLEILVDALGYQNKEVRYGPLVAMRYETTSRIIEVKKLKPVKKFKSYR